MEFSVYCSLEISSHVYLCLENNNYLMEDIKNLLPLSTRFQPIHPQQAGVRTTLTLDVMTRTFCKKKYGVFGFVVFLGVYLHSKQKFLHIRSS